MKAINIIPSATLLLFAALAFTACGSEDTPEADHINPSDYFQPADGDNSEESQMRRDFFDKYGSYLLFNDTIQSVYLGADINGDDRYFVETIDLTYTVGQTGFGKTSSFYTFTYLEDPEQRKQVVSYMEENILPHFSKKFKPYSWLLANVITGRSSRVLSQQKTNTPYAVVGQRCTAIAANYLIQRQRTEAQVKNYTNRVLNIIVGQLVKDHATAFAEFNAISASYYNKSASDLGFSSSGDVQTKDLYGWGFLTKGTSLSIICDQSTDLTAYASSIVENTEEQIQQKYAGYELVLRKHEIMRKILIELGYIF